MQKEYIIGMDMYTKILKRSAVIVLCLMVWAGIAFVDLVSIGGQKELSSFQKFRVRMHFEYYTNLSWFLPPIGPLKQIHNMGRYLDAFIDKDFPPTYSMDFVRSLIFDSEDCRKKLQDHEAKVQKSQASKHTKIMCEVPFGYGAQDTFAIQVYSEAVEGKMKTAFFVNGLGLSPITKDQSPMHVLRPMGDNRKYIESIVFPLSDLITTMVQEDMAKVLWVNLTDRKETSVYSDSNNRMSIEKWIEQTQASNKKGEGTSAHNF